MAAKSSKTITIAFGQFHIIAKLYTVATAESTKFSNPPVDKYTPKVKEATDKPTDEKKKRYEYQKEQFVEFTQSELEDIAGDSVNFLDIYEVTSASNINPLQIEQSYFLKPDKGMDKGYALIYQSLQPNNVAVGILGDKTQERLVILRTHNDGLLLQYLFYNKELNDCKDMCADVVLSDQEKALAKSLANAFKKKNTDMCKYKDGFVERLCAAVQLKLGGKKVTRKTIEKRIGISMEQAIEETLRKVG
jgi:DNA end-binding protein Ku